MSDKQTTDDAAAAGRKAWDDGGKFACPYEFGSKQSLAWKRAFFERGYQALSSARNKEENHHEQS